MAQDLKAAKKPYSAPAFQILDAGTAKVELEAASATQDANARQMLSVINQELERMASQAEPARESPHPKMQIIKPMKHEKLSWNPATQEWFCTNCGRTSERSTKADACSELEQHDCQIPWVEVSEELSTRPANNLDATKPLPSTSHSRSRRV